jgi:RecA-family ATPase
MECIFLPRSRIDPRLRIPSPRLGRRRQLQSARELLAKTFDHIPFIIDEGLLNEGGLLFVGGPPKAYKSFVLNSLCYHLATGTNLFGACRRKSRTDRPAFNVQRKYRVLLIEQEIGDWSLKERLESIAYNVPLEQRDLLLDNLFTHSCDRSLRLDQKEGADKICKLIEECKPDILCLDPLIEFHHADENDTKAMAEVLRGVDYVRDRFNLAVIINHHAGKNERPGADALRGSNTIYGKGDTYLMLKVHNRDAAIIQVQPTLRRGIPIRYFLLKLDWQSLQLRFNGWCSNKLMTEALKEAAPLTDEEQ